MFHILSPTKECINFNSAFNSVLNASSSFLWSHYWEIGDGDLDCPIVLLLIISITQLNIWAITCNITRVPRGFSKYKIFGVQLNRYILYLLVIYQENG